MSDRYLKLFTSLAKHPKFRLRLKSDADRVAFIIALCEAKDAGSDGRFESREHLELVLGQYAGSIEPMIDAGLIDELPETGELWIHDFEERQRPMSSAERQAAFRARHGIGRSPNKGERDDDPDGSPDGSGGGRNGASPHVDNAVDNASRNAGGYDGRNARVTKSVTDHVTRTRGEEIREEVPYVRDDEEMDALIGALVMAGVWTKPTKKMILMVQRMVRDHGHEMVEKALRDELPAGHEGLFSRVGKRCRRWAQERHETYEAARSSSEAAGHKLELPAGVTEEEAAQRAAAIASFVNGFGNIEGEG